MKADFETVEKIFDPIINWLEEHPILFIAGFVIVLIILIFFW